MTFKRWLILTVLLFIGGLIWGLLVPADEPGTLTESVAAVKGLSDFVAELPPTSVFLFIFGKNVMAVVVSFMFSPLFLVVPVGALILNGGILGLVAALVVQEKSLGYLLAAVLPHGIFELPALFIGEAAALSFGTAVILALVKKERRKLLLPNLRRNAKYLALAVILLLPAALIETYLTPLLVR